MRQCGYQEAIDYANSGLALLKLLAPSRRRKDLELSLQFLKGISLASTQRYASAESKEPFSRARLLAQRGGGDNAPAFQALAGMWSLNLVRGDLRSALELGQRLLGIGQRTRDSGFLHIAHMTAGVTRFYLGNLLGARRHLENAGRYYDRRREGFETSVYGWDPGVVIACYTAKAYWLLGYPEKASVEADKAEARVRALVSPFHVAFGNGLLATYFAYRSDSHQALRLAESAVAKASEGGFQHALALGMIIQGWALGRERRAGSALLEEGVNKWTAMGAQMGIPTFLALQAQTGRGKGQIEKNLACIETGLATSSKTADTYYDAELYRVKAGLLLRSNGAAKKLRQQRAEESLFRAIQTARRQQAKSLELRATQDLSTLWQMTGKKKEAKRILAKICGWFTEGFDTPDLKQAKMILENLRQ